MQSKADRYFYSVTSGFMLVLMLIGFKSFFLAGHKAGGRPIPESILGYVLVHGIALSLWVVLFFAQSVLIAAKNRKLHMKLGWITAAVAVIIAVTGPLVAVAAPRLRPSSHHFGMTYAQFILPMFVEIGAFSVFVLLGIAYRKRAAIHRSMMLLATLSVISGATARTDFIVTVFGKDNGWVGLFGPLLVLGGAILLVRTMMTRSLDRWYAAGYASLALVYITAMHVAVGPTWTQVAERIAGG